jgi:hypothetical protein
VILPQNAKQMGKTGAKGAHFLRWLATKHDDQWWFSGQRITFQSHKCFVLFVYQPMPVAAFPDKTDYAFLIKETELNAPQPGFLSGPVASCIVDYSQPTAAADDVKHLLTANEEKSTVGVPADTASLHSSCFSQVGDLVHPSLQSKHQEKNRCGSSHTGRGA